MAIDSVHGLIGLMIAKRKRRGRDSNSAVNRRPLSKFHVFNTVQRKAFGPMHAFPGHMLAQHGIIVVPRAVLNLGVIIVPYPGRIVAKRMVKDLPPAFDAVAAVSKALGHSHNIRKRRPPSLSVIVYAGCGRPQSSHYRRS